MMNPRRVAKVIVGLILVSFFAILGLTATKWLGRILGIWLAVLFGILLFRKTYKDDIFMEKYRNRELKGQKLLDTISEVERTDWSSVTSEIDRTHEPQSNSNKWFVANVVFLIFATPAVVLAKLLKLQK